jgi:type 1 glutamine amidotransferase
MTTRRETLQLLLAGMAQAQGVVRERPPRKPYVVFLSGETEYNSEATLPRIAQELESKHGMRCTVVVASGKADLPGLEALEDADLAVAYLSSLALPASQLNQIKAYLDAGKPLVGLRTSIQAFDNWKEFGEQVLGAPWRYDYGSTSSTDVKVIPEAAGYSILRGVASEFHCRSWLYHVLPLPTSVSPLLVGVSVGESKRPDRVPNPVAWTKTYKGGRVFYTSLGHPEDFQVEPFRKLLVNAIYWALGKTPPAP